MPPCAILWNFTGDWVADANEVELEGGSIGLGTFLAPERWVEILEQSTLSGRLLAGGSILVDAATIRPPQ